MKYWLEIPVAPRNKMAAFRKSILSFVDAGWELPVKNVFRFAGDKKRAFPSLKSGIDICLPLVSVRLSKIRDR